MCTQVFSLDHYESKCGCKLRQQLSELVLPGEQYNLADLVVGMALDEYVVCLYDG